MRVSDLEEGTPFALPCLWRLLKFEPTYCGPPAPPIEYYGFRFEPIRAVFTDRIWGHHESTLTADWSLEIARCNA